jgi:hypothetical protein
MEDKYYANRTKGKWCTAQTDNTVIRKDCDDCEYHKIKGDEKCVKYLTDNGKPYMIFIRCANRESEG